MMHDPLLRPIVVAPIRDARLAAPRHVWSGEDQALPVAGGRCSFTVCGRVCGWDRLYSWYMRSVSAHGMDGEGPCQCWHHEDAGASFRTFMYGLAVDGLPWGTTVIGG